MLVTVRCPACEGRGLMAGPLSRRRACPRCYGCGWLGLAYRAVIGGIQVSP